jgi:hypothetical protein
MQGTSMPDTTALLFQTHFFDGWCARAYARLVAACPPHFRPVVLIHLPPGAEPPPRLAEVEHHIVRTPEMRLPAYRGKSGGEAWNIWSGGHTDLILLHFWRAQPGHARYWVLEYDVRWSGDWRRFFDSFEDDPADLLCPGIISRDADPGWFNWPTLAGPEELPEAVQLRAFLPVFRASAALLRHMDTAYRAGWGGHCECTWPTLARHAGLDVVDLGGDGPLTPARYRGRFYSNTPAALYLAPGTLVFKPVLHRIGRRRNMLWHPVKPFHPRAELRDGLRDIRRRIGMLVRGAAGLAGVPLPDILQPGAMEAADRARAARRAARRAEAARAGPVLPSKPAEGHGG